MSASDTRCHLDEALTCNAFNSYPSCETCTPPDSPDTRSSTDAIETLIETEGSMQFGGYQVKKSWFNVQRLSVRGSRLKAYRYLEYCWWWV